MREREIIKYRNKVIWPIVCDRIDHVVVSVLNNLVFGEFIIAYYILIM